MKRLKNWSFNHRISTAILLGFLFVLAAAGAKVFTQQVLLIGPENTEMLSITDSTNADGIGLYAGSGTPESVVTAQLGSLYFDHANGAIYVKDTGDGNNTGWAALGTGGSGDSISIDGVGVTDPDFVSTGDVDFIDTSNTVTANINANSIEASMIADGDHGDFTYASNSASLDAGVVDFTQLATDLMDLQDVFNAVSLDSPVVSVSSNGSTITLSLEANGGGDVRMRFSDGIHTHDCTPADTVTLTAGTDTSPQVNYVYVLQSNKTLTASTSSFPAAEHAPIATVLCQSAASLQTDGAYKVHAWTDHVAGSDNQGHLAHLNYWIRQQHATWQSGVALTPSVGASTFDIATTVGTVLQLHPHAYPAFDTSTGSEALIVNHPDTAYKVAEDLTLAYVDKDANGTTLGDGSSDFYNLVIWGVVSEDSSDCKLMINVPDGVYGNDNGDQASNDDDATAVYTIPPEFKGTGFLIARLTVRENGGTYTIENQEDLRGLFPATSAGSGGGGGEANTASNVGTDGIGVFKQKSGVDLEFKHVAPGSTKITVSASGDDIDIDADGGVILDGEVSGNGLVTRTAAETYTNRTIAGTANEVEVTNGDGVSGNPTIGLPDNVTKRVAIVIILDDTTAITVADGIGDFEFVVPGTLDGYNLVDVEANVFVAGTTGTQDIQVHNVTDAADMLSTVMTIDSTELSTRTAATPPMIDAANDDVSAGDRIRFDSDAIQTTPAQGLTIELTFQLP